MDQEVGNKAVARLTSSKVLLVDIIKKAADVKYGLARAALQVLHWCIGLAQSLEMGIMKG